MRRDVAARIELTVSTPADLVFAVAVAAAYPQVTERIDVTLDGAPVEAAEHADAHGTRLHRVTVGIGRLVFDYSARIEGRSLALPIDPVELIRYTRPSRYAESDVLLPTAVAEFAGIDDPAQLLSSAASWVGTRLAYVSGSSLPTDGAVRTLLARRGVCRDYAHLVVALLRARNIPSRVVSVYAPGLTPMDFHAVAEAWIDGRWCAVDATTLAPRESLVRIATGRDAADTAFLTTLSGLVTLNELTVSAVADSLPDDDLTRLVEVA